MAPKSASEALAIPRRIREEGGDTESSESTTDLASSLASSSLRDDRYLYRPLSSIGELHGSGSPHTPAGSYVARAASMSHAQDVKRGLSISRQRQTQARQQRAAGERAMKRTHSVGAAAESSHFCEQSGADELLQQDTRGPASDVCCCALNRGQTMEHDMLHHSSTGGTGDI